MSFVFPRRAQRLSAAEMKAALGSLADIHKRYLADQPPAVLHELSRWIDQHVVQTTSVYLLSEGNPAQIHQGVFKAPNVSSYLLHLGYSFYAINGDRPEWAQLLAANLAQGLSLDGPDTELNLIPQPIVSMMPTHALLHGQWTGRFKRPVWILWHWMRYWRAPMTLTGFLTSNKLLMLLLMLRMIASPVTVATEGVTSLPGPIAALS